MEILAYTIAVLIGISLGLIGGGGSILTVPVLVYLLQIDPLMATTYSLFIVGITSVVGGAKAYTKKLIDFRAVALFGIPSILSIFITRHFLLPAIPDYLFSFGDLAVTKDVLLMIFFALLMFAAAMSMIRNELIPEPSEVNVHQAEPAPPGMSHVSGHHEPNLVLVLPGLFIGLVTGLLGAGGGFLIIPTLVVIIRMPMKIAVGTSLLIVAINSLFGFLFSLSIIQKEFDWTLMLVFTLLAVIGIIIGSKLSDRIPAETLKKAFGWFILVMGVYILIRELWL
ncbi:MAG: sulfite exporter TauE/SafE family protein [Chitinophagaceae bacterium]|nr:MAG: sulfite exporter TauE/SafE family protein [Chitinophagaceae bacterium]